MYTVHVQYSRQKNQADTVLTALTMTGSIFKLLLGQCLSPDELDHLVVILGQCVSPDELDQLVVILGQCVSPDDLEQLMVILGQYVSPDDNLE